MSPSALPLVKLVLAFRRVAVLALALFAAPVSAHAAGVTIVTHGFQLTETDHDRGWVAEMTKAIADWGGSQAIIYEMEVGPDYSDNNFFPALRVTNFVARNTGTAPHLSTNPEVIVQLYWDQVAHLVHVDAPVVTTRRIAAAVLPFLLGVISDVGLEHPLAELPLHLIGHSRGGSLMAELARLLGARGVWVDQLTLLDPQVLVGDAPLDVPETVIFADNYYQTFTGRLGGERLSGASNRRLKSLAGGYEGALGEHSDAHLWYFGTITDATPVSDGAAEITSTMRAQWWTFAEDEGWEAGWLYSRLGGGSSERFSRVPVEAEADAPAAGLKSAGNRTAVVREGLQWPSVLALDVLGQNFAYAGESVALEYEYQCGARNCRLTLHLDRDRNPYNGNDFVSIPAPPTVHPGTGRKTVRRVVTWDTSGQPDGIYFPYALIESSGLVRYVYADESLRILTPVGSGVNYAPTLVRDIRPGSASSDPSWLCASAGRLFFSAYEPTHGRELWKSNGTPEGTLLVRDFLPGSASSKPEQMTDVNGRVFYVADGGGSISTFNIHGRELFKSNGSASGTGMVKDINGNNVDSFITGLCNVNGTLFFAADTASLGTELWKSNGTASGTVLVRDIYSGSSDSRPQSLVNVGGTLFFSAVSPGYYRQLWKSDGTAAGTQLPAITSDTSSSFGNGFTAPKWLTPMNGLLYFAADDVYTFPELWRSDGTADGTYYISNIYPESNGGADVAWITNVNNTLYFAATSSATGRELWKSNGFSSPSLVRDINPGGDSQPVNFCNVNGTLFFAANDGSSNVELWRSDGSTNGTQLVRNINPSGPSTPSSPVALGNVLYFTAYEDTHGRELWRSDGTFSGTELVADLDPGPADSDPQELTVVGDSLFFTANSPGAGRELWRVGPPRAPRVDRVPVVRFDAPANGAHVTDETVTLSGSATDDQGVDDIEVIWSSGAARSEPLNIATSGNSWTVTGAALLPGANVFRVQAVDSAGQRSKPVQHTIYRDAWVPIDVRVEGDGSVTSTASLGVDVAAGRAYEFTARASAGHVFLGWTGASSSSALKIRIAAQSGLGLVARFVPTPFMDRAGAYGGELAPLPGVSGFAGIAQLGLARTGSYTGRMVVDGRATALKGRLDGSGFARVAKGRVGSEPLIFQLYLDSASATPFIHGDIRAGARGAIFRATRN